MSDLFIRTRLLFGEQAMQKLASSTVAVFGAGGVGGYVIEALARSGVGHLVIVDNDTVSLSNRNRQILALQSTVGLPKTEVAAQRVHDINPDCIVEAYQTFYLPDTAAQFDFTRYDYVVDAIDTVTGKLQLIAQAKAAGTPVISCMGTGNKTDPSRLEVADIYDTAVCPLARIIRKECRKRGIESLKVVYSREPPLETAEDPALAAEREGTGRRDTPGSTAFVPPAAGLLIASVVVKDLIGFVHPNPYAL